VLDYYFASFQIKIAKPDPAAFQYVFNAMSCKPSEILFLDDKRMNVDAARRVGMKAERVNGIGQVKKILSEYGALAYP
jgi:HAD superfamily hydrolase (TIGR01509 family)